MTVVWTAPDGVTGITSYDLRFILTSAMGFTLSDRLDAGTHYIKVTRSGGDSTGG